MSLLAPTVTEILGQVSDELLASNCSAPLRLESGVREVLVRCGSRSRERCPACAARYARDEYMVATSGIKLIGLSSEGVTVSPVSDFSGAFFFLTLTLPSFGAVHSLGACRCGTSHADGSFLVGVPLSSASYDYLGHAVSNIFAPRLFNETIKALRYYLPAGYSFELYGVPEYQKRGAIHIHVLLRFNAPPPAQFVASIPAICAGVSVDPDPARDFVLAREAVRASYVGRIDSATRFDVETGEIFTEFLPFSDDVIEVLEMAESLPRVVWGSQIDLKKVGADLTEAEAEKVLGYAMKTLSYTTKTVGDSYGGYVSAFEKKISGIAHLLRQNSLTALKPLKRVSLFSAGKLFGYKGNLRFKSRGWSLLQNLTHSSLRAERAAYHRGATDDPDEVFVYAPSQSVAEVAGFSATRRLTAALADGVSLLSSAVRAGFGGSSPDRLPEAYRAELERINSILSPPSS